MQKLLVTQLINKHHISSLKADGPPLDELSQVLCFAVPKGVAPLLGLLNDGQALVIADGTLEALRKKWYPDYDSPSKSRIIVGGDFGYLSVNSLIE